MFPQIISNYSLDLQWKMFCFPQIGEHHLWYRLIYYCKIDCHVDGGYSPNVRFTFCNVICRFNGFLRITLSVTASFRSIDVRGFWMIPTCCLPVTQMNSNFHPSGWLLLNDTIFCILKFIEYFQVCINCVRVISVFGFCYLILVLHLLVLKPASSTTFTENAIQKLYN